MDNQPQVVNVGNSSFEDGVYKPRKEDGLYRSPYGKNNSQSDHSQVPPTKATQQENPNAIRVTASVSEISNSPKVASSPSKISGQSSITSTGLGPMKKEIGDSHSSTTKVEPPSPSNNSSQLSPARSTTPIGLNPSVKLKTSKIHRENSKAAKLRFADLRPRTSIPSNITATVLAQQSIHAAYSSRLKPFALHPDEYQLLRNHLCHLHVTVYLNIRNRILRLWVRNPLVSVTPEEAAGCALASRWLGLAEVAYQWLLRKGYINFGCVEVPDLLSGERAKKYKLKRSRRKTIIVIGAGMAGLGCARQLEGLFSHYREKWASIGEEPPKVIVLEGRSRIGGRVYSHPLKNQTTTILPEYSRCTAEMGAHIITGFDHGNPLSMIIRGQLALPYYPLKDNSTLFDVDGQMVDKVRDIMVEKLYNDVLDRASVYRHRIAAAKTVDGDKKLIEAGRDPQGEIGPPLSTMEGESEIGKGGVDGNDVEPVPGGVDKLTGKAHMIAGSRKKAPPAKSAENIGWQLASNVLAYGDLSLDAVAEMKGNPTLGAAMDEAVKQYQFLLDLSPQDMRLINWHYANLEYANAANVGKLSLGGWDQDIGNEFEGEHAQLIGGYIQVPRGIWQYPSKLDVRTYKAVKEIAYTPSDGEDAIAGVHCDDGDILEADHVVLTVPLGVLKEQCISFDPPLPDWKLGPIDRLGFGTLNKVILVFEKPFWDVDQDMFGLLREAEVVNSLDQEDYESNRGKFYLFWNCIKTSGLPVLIALMAGDAAHQAETVSDAVLVDAVTGELARMFKQEEIPIPSESIVTRWGKDRFARGSYSYVAPTSLPGDYEAMARPLGNLHFAGEATCGTHPATVHGAYISGLRAASEVIDALLGPIQVPSPLVTAPRLSKAVRETQSQKRKAEGTILGETPAAREARLEAYESDILAAIYNALGYRPSKPGKPGSNPFLLFTKDKWTECKDASDAARRATTGSLSAKASRNEIRIALGQMWREASDDVRKPYLEQTSQNRITNMENAATFEDRLAAWDAQAIEVRLKYIREHPGVLSPYEEERMWQELGDAGLVENEPMMKLASSGRYADTSGSEMEVQ